jgi:hypothetical protein
MAYARVKAIPRKKSYKWKSALPIFPHALKILLNEGTESGNRSGLQRKFGLAETGTSH